jgi:rSAM/selenodomain-associated transferase 2
MISVIIPTFNERQNIDGCIGSVLSGRCGPEIIVCDGGSTDGTPDVAAGYGGVTLLRTHKGRGTQMNAGAVAARGDILLFLHADTRLEKGWCEAITRRLDDEKPAGGAFTLSIDSPGMQFRLIEWWVKFRCRIFALPYGDQGLFMRRKTFVEIGGYRDIPLMEDVDIMARLKKTGKIVVLREKAITSARKWEREGWVFTSVRNQLIMLLYRLGVDPRKLDRLYYR